MDGGIILSKRDAERLQRSLRKSERPADRPMSTRRRSPPITGRPIRAKVQTTGTGTADTIGVKRLSNAGVEVGDVIDVYVVDSRLEVDLDSYWPRLDEGAVVRIQQVQGFWHLASPILHNVGKWS